MRSLSVFITLAVVLGALFTFQGFRVLSVWGANPNFILVAFLFLLFSGARRWMIAGLLFLFLVYSFFTFPFWLTESAVIVIVVLFAWFLKGTLTGNALSDFFIVLFLAVPAFYIFLSVVQGIVTHGLNFSLYVVSFPSVFFFELFSNLLFGAVVWFGCRRVAWENFRRR